MAGELRDAELRAVVRRQGTEREQAPRSKVAARGLCSIRRLASRNHSQLGVSQLFCDPQAAVLQTQRGLTARIFAETTAFVAWRSHS